MSVETNTGREKHPRGLPILFFSEMWERFSFYGMRALLVLYMTKALGYVDRRAYDVYGAYCALVYTCPVIGGRLADGILGYRRAIIIGGILMSLGHFCMAVPQTVFFYLALALIAVGNGFFKANMSSLLGLLYEPGDHKRDAGFTIFYMGINLGALLAPLVCGTVGQKINWHYGFGLAGIGMLAGLIWFIRGREHLQGRGEAPDPALLDAPWFLGLSRFHVILLSCIAIVPLSAYALYTPALVEQLLYVLGVVVVGALVYIGFKCGRQARDRTFLVFILMAFNVLFWAFFEQAGSSLTLFTDRNVDRQLFGIEFGASNFQAINPAFILLFGAPFAAAFTRLHHAGRSPSIPMKFGLALLQLALGFAFLVIGAGRADAMAKTHVAWLIFSYLFQTTGELSQSPIGLSAITKLAPPKYVATFMGAWFLSFGFAHNAAAMIAKLTAVKKSASLSEAASAMEQLASYATVFEQVAYVAAGAGLLLVIGSRLVNKLAHGVE